MKITISSFLFIFLLSNAVNGQDHMGTNGDMRTFAIQNQITITQNPFVQKTNTKGSRFIYSTWVKGSATNKEGVVFSEGLFNFDNVTQNLIMKMQDSTVGFLIDNSQLKSISLSDGNITYNFEKVPYFKNNLFYNALVKGNKYSLYSFTKTTFVPSDYQTNGIVSSGNIYDEYKNEVTYYIVFPDGHLNEIALKKKSIRKVFEAEKGKVDVFFAQMNDANIDENFLKSLVLSLQ